MAKKAKRKGAQTEKKTSTTEISPIHYEALRIQAEYGIDYHIAYNRMVRGDTPERAARPVGPVGGPPADPEVYDKIVHAIAEYQQANSGQAPTISYVMEQCGFNSTSTTQRYLRKLEAEGRVRQVHKKYVIPDAKVTFPNLGNTQGDPVFAF